MNETECVLPTNLGLLLLCMTGLWLISIRLKDVSFIDSFWPIGFIVVAGSTFLMTGGGTERRELLLMLTAVWGVRLGAYLFLRWRREGADRRYVDLLARAKGNVHIASFIKVFLLQGVILWVVSLPVQLGQIEPKPLVIGWLGWCGVVLFAIGIFFEALGDHQLTEFKSDPANRGKVMDRGLWRYTRHPNYFGDACVWWGLYLVAAETPLGMWAFIGPALLTWLLLKLSGVPLLERRLRESRPGYQEYVQRTSAFFPWPPRKD